MTKFINTEPGRYIPGNIAMYTKEMAEQRKEIMAMATELLTSGTVQHDDFDALLKMLEPEFPEVPPHRIKTAAAKAIRRYRFTLAR